MFKMANKNKCDLAPVKLLRFEYATIAKTYEFDFFHISFIVYKYKITMVSQFCGCDRPATVTGNITAQWTMYIATIPRDVKVYSVCYAMLCKYCDLGATILF